MRDWDHGVAAVWLDPVRVPWVKELAGKVYGTATPHIFDLFRLLHGIRLPAQASLNNVCTMGVSSNKIDLGGCGDAGLRRCSVISTCSILHNLRFGVAEKVNLHSQLDHKLNRVTAVRTSIESVHIGPSW